MKEIIPFQYEQNQIRVILDDQGNPWWVAKDVCEVLDINDHLQAVERLDADERGRYSVPTPSGVQVMVCVSESGLYSLILTSRKPEAKAFKRWITHDVIPSIRKTGTYLPNVQEKKKLASLAPEFRAAISIAKACGFTGNQAVLSANIMMKKVHGENILELMDQVQITCEVQEKHYNATDLGSVFFNGLSAQKMNSILESMGFQESYKDSKGRKNWRPTEKGKPYCVLKDTGKKYSNGAPVQSAFWIESTAVQARPYVDAFLPGLVGPLAKEHQASIQKG